MLDAKSDFEDAQFLRMVTLHTLIDLHSHFHSVNQPPASYRCGKKKIEFILLWVFCGVSGSHRGGMTTYNNGLKLSDHRALFIDLETGSILLTTGTGPIPPIAGGVSTPKKPHVKVYLATVHKHLAAHNIVARCTHLREHAHVQHIEEVKLEVENIERGVTNAVVHVEKKVTNKYYGYGWSPRLALAGRTVTFWRTCPHVHKAGQDPMMMMPLLANIKNLG